MKKAYTYCILWLSLLTFRSEAQFVPIPDPNFASFLSSAYPATVSGGMLDTNAAKLVTGNMFATNKNIQDATGIEYFISISQLHLNKNNLTFLPPIPRLSNLKWLRVDSNQLTSLPDLRMITGLQKLNCAYNQLTSLPDMNGLSNLYQFFCHQNRLTALPNLTGMTALDHFIISDNYISSLPDMSTLVNLRRFLSTSNQFTSVDLTPLVGLEEVHFKWNRLTSFPKITGMTQLTEIQVNNNYIDSLPDLSSFVNLNLFVFNSNNLTFEDLLPLSSHPNFSSFTFAPQRFVGQSETLTGRANHSFTYGLGIDSLVTTNNYTWYHNGDSIQSTTQPYLNFSFLNAADSGVYSCRIRNTSPALNALTLYSNPITLRTAPCMDLSQFKISTPSPLPCFVPVVATVDESNIYYSQGPLSYMVRNTFTQSASTFTTPQLNVAGAGIYDIQVTDSTGCSVWLDQVLKLPRDPECEAIIYPDRPGAEARYFVEIKGTARIYSISGQKIAEFSTPGYWDGRDLHGKILDSGLYMLIINEQIGVPVSVMRTN